MSVCLCGHLHVGEEWRKVKKLDTYRWAVVASDEQMNKVTHERYKVSVIINYVTTIVLQFRTNESATGAHWENDQLTWSKSIDLSVWLGVFWIHHFCFVQFCTFQSIANTFLGVSCTHHLVVLFASIWSLTIGQQDQSNKSKQNPIMRLWAEIVWDGCNTMDGYKMR